MGASITLAGESLIAQKIVAKKPLNVVRFVFANVPGLDPALPVDRAAGKPPAGQIVYTHEIASDSAGYVNPNQVVYSAQLGSDQGDWDFNWIGLETDESILFAVATVALQEKRRNIPPLQIGNNLTRNFLVAFDGAQALTGITIDASTWQHDFTVRLAGIDERERLSNRDMYGRACFFGSALQLEKVGSAYQLKPGVAYVEGIRVMRSAVLPVAPASFPTTAWLEVALQRALNDVVASWQIVFAATRPDYADSLGVRHYCVPIADLANANSIVDRRTVEPIDAALVSYFASRAFVRDEINKLDSKQSVVVTTTGPIILNGSQRIDDIAVYAGDRVLVKNQADASQNGVYIVSGGNWIRAADADASLEVTPGMLVAVEQGTLNGDSLWQLVTDGPINLGVTALQFEVASGPAGIAAGTYRSVTVDKRGRVIGGTNPTTLAGAGITDALTTAQTLQMLPFRAHKVFAAPGVFSWTVPDGVYRVYAKVIGAGGGGRNSSVFGGGGGGGGVAEGLVNVTPGQVISITVGAGGAGAWYDTTNGVGGTGGSSAFGAYMSATGGSSGQTSGQGGYSGAGSGGDLNYGLGDGHAGYRVSTTTLAVAGGGGGPGGAGVAVTASSASSGSLRNGRGPGGGGGGRMDNGGYAGDGAPGAVTILY
jgi:hypothetical protein